MKKIILASASARRKDLLKMIGIPFKAVESNFEEFIDPSLDHHLLAKKLSLGKAKAVSQKYPNAIIIAADTFVVCNGEILGKAYTKEEARKMLEKLSGKAHLVITGFTIIDTETKRTISKSVETKVSVKKLADQEIEAYVKTGEPIEKAGAYAIQGLGSFLIRKIEGDYFNVVGLPIFSLVESLKMFGIRVL